MLYGHNKHCCGSMMKMESHCIWFVVNQMEMKRMKVIAINGHFLDLFLKQQQSGMLVLIQGRWRMVELAKESITMHRILDPLFIYFDTNKQWVPLNGLGLIVVSDMTYFVDSQVLITPSVPK